MENSDGTELQVRHDASQRRFEAQVNGQTAYLTYSCEGNTSVSFDHTFVPEELRGRGVAAALVRAALLEARQQGWRVIPRCSYVDLFFQRNPEYSDLLAR
jgi:predicted GNAT family acetyltransferase